MDSPAVSSRLFSTTLTFRTPQENHIVSVPFETIEKKHEKKKLFSPFFVSPGHLGTIQNLIPGWMTIVKLLKQVKNWQSPSRDPWSNCPINSRKDDKGQSYYFSGRQKRQFKDNLRTPGVCGVVCGISNSFHVFAVWRRKCSRCGSRWQEISLLFAFSTVDAGACDETRAIQHEKLAGAA